MDLYFLITIFLTVSLKDWGIKVIYIKPYGSSLGLVIMAFIIIALVEVLIR